MSAMQVVCLISFLPQRLKAVIPAKAGIQCHMLNPGWIPAFAGMTRKDPCLRHVANQVSFNSADLRWNFLDVHAGGEVAFQFDLESTVKRSLMSGVVTVLRA